MASLSKLQMRKNRQARVRKKVFGTSTRPRLSVFKSNKYIYAQVINDEDGRTLFSASSFEPSLKKKYKGLLNVSVAGSVGKLVGERALEKGIKEVVFDRGGNLYHGRVKALADQAREAGLKF